MQLNVQKSMRTTSPRRLSRVKGSELIHSPVFLSSGASGSSPVRRVLTGTGVGVGSGVGAAAWAVGAVGAG